MSCGKENCDAKAITNDGEIIHRKKIELYYICTVLGALFLGVAIGLFLGGKEYLREGWSYLFFAISIIINIINLAFFQKKYLDFLNSLNPAFSFADKSAKELNSV